METPACSCPSKQGQAPDESTTFNLEAGIKAKLPDPCTIFKLDAGVKPMLPDPSTAFKLEVGMEPKMEISAFSCPSKQAPDESTIFILKGMMLKDPCTIFKLDDAGVKPMPPDPSTPFKLEVGMEPKVPEPEASSSTKMNLEADMMGPKLPEACANKTELLEARIEPKLPEACARTELKAGIEQKPEPCEEDAPVLLPPSRDAAADDDPDITPLSGSHPFFSMIMSRCHVEKSFQLVIPTRIQGLLPEARVPAVLLCGGRSWPTSYCGDLKCKKFESASWRVFAADKRLRVGDACVFELMGDEGAESASRSRGKGKTLVFRVQVLRGDLPEEVTSRGATADEPLVIVD